MHDPDPFRAPEADISSTVSSGNRVYKPSHVGIATFFGTPAAGFWLIAANFDALGKRERKNSMLGIGIVSTIVLLALTFYLPGNFPALALSLVTVVIMIQICKNLQEHDMQSFILDGGGFHSGWRALGIGILGLIAVFGITFVGVMVYLMMFPEAIFE